jgi:hypothetical protein
MGTEIQVGPTGKTLLPLSVKRPGQDLVGSASGPSAGAVPWQTTAGAARQQG